jgi:PAS domain-containing protein
MPKHDQTIAGLEALAPPINIEDRKRAEEALRDREHSWRSLTQTLPQLVWTATPDGACDYHSLVGAGWICYAALSVSLLSISN